MKSLPNEVWCILFSYLDKKSLRNSTATCKHWFELIRNDSNLSGQVCLPNDGLLDLKRKIKDSQWIWTRWPVLKTLGLGKCFVGEIFTHLPNLPQNFGLIYYELTINPKNEIESLGIENASNLELSIEESRLLEIIRESFSIIQAMKLIGENGRNLKRLAIFFPKFPWWMDDEFSRLLEHAFVDMFNGLWNFKSLKIVELNLAIYCDLISFPNYSGEITHLTVKDMPFFCHDTLSKISHKFPNLTHFRVNNALMNSPLSDEDVPWNYRRPEDLPKIIEDTFKDVTKVEIQLQVRTWIDGLIDTVVGYEFSKMPFQKCVLKKLEN